MLRTKSPRLPRPLTPSARPAGPRVAAPATKLLLVDFRSGEPVAQHPEVAALLRQGWQIRSAVPRLVESEGTKLLVILMQEGRMQEDASQPQTLAEA